MTRTTPGRRTAAALALLAGAAALTTPGPATAVAAADHRQAPHRTSVTFTVADCEGCELQLENARLTDDGDVEHWSSKRKEVRDGEVTFTVASKRTRGMAVLVHAPWEGHTGYTTTVAMRYAGNAVGEEVTFKEARGKKKASACWEGVRVSDSVTIPLVVRKVMVDGVQERVKGSIAFAAETQQWLDPARRAPRGVLGSQDVNVCR